MDRATAESCLRSIKRFDELAVEASLIRQQRDETMGAHVQCLNMLTLERDFGVDWKDRSQEWEAKARAAEESKPSRAEWLGYGVALGASAAVIVFFILR